MDKRSTKSNSNSSVNETNPNGLAAKLKRLKIEESILLQSINKNIPVGQDTENEVIISNFSTFSEFKDYERKVNSMYGAVKHSFRDLKSSITSKEMFDNVDIEDIKKCTLELESHIKTLKSYLHKTLVTLKTDEQQLNQNVNENPALIYKLKKQPRVQTAKYNEIVPSPVKTLMNSPLRCSEVQEFQDFMSNSGNRYGGWNEYYHNIFVNYWVKHFGSQSTVVEGNESSIENTDSYYLFLRDLQTKLQDISEDAIMAHVKWYSKYLYLKVRKQKAIDRWRSNRQIMKSAKEERTAKVDIKLRTKTDDKRQEYKGSISDGSCNEDYSVSQSPQKTDTRFIRKCFNTELNVEHLKNMRKENHDEVLNFLKSTIQWNLKCNSKDTSDFENSHMYDVENIKKLNTPFWRLGL